MFIFGHFWLPDRPHLFLATRTQKNIELWSLDWPHPFLSMLTPKTFDQLNKN